MNPSSSCICALICLIFSILAFFSSSRRAACSARETLAFLLRVIIVIIPLLRWGQIGPCFTRFAQKHRTGPLQTRAQETLGDGVRQDKREDGVCSACCKKKKGLLLLLLLPLLLLLLLLQVSSFNFHQPPSALYIVTFHNGKHVIMFKISACIFSAFRNSQILRTRIWCLQMNLLAPINYICLNEFKRLKYCDK
jgi:hypothetical protein